MTPPIPLISEEEKKKLEEAVASFEALQAELPPRPKSAVTETIEVPEEIIEVPEETEEPAAPAPKTTYVRKVQLKELQEKDEHVVIIRKGERS